ncbi:MAG: hypothetical protein KF744_05545 [Taibaiella sp.]|nr:hypothetical protein [Taibaiella sp.]
MKSIVTYGFRLATLLVCVVTLWSCGKTSTITYRVRNMATDSIIVVREYADTAHHPDTVWLAYNQEQRVAIAEKGKNHVSSYRMDNGIIPQFYTLDVYRLGSGRKALTDFRDASQWAYKEYSRYTADYTADVTDADFQ